MTELAAEDTDQFLTVYIQSDPIFRELWAPVL